MQIDIYAKSITNPRKPDGAKCGDAYAVAHSEDGGLVMLAVSDGVSGAPCDWRASFVACDTVRRAFEAEPVADAQRLKTFVDKAHRAVQADPTPGCKGMLSSLSVVVLDVAQRRIVYSNVADSAVLVGPEENLEQITRDDVAAVPVMRNGQPLLQGGVPVFARGVTRCMGQAEPLEVSAEERVLRPGDVLVLVSDGVTKDAAFSNGLGEILAAGNWETHLDAFLHKCAQDNEDDATLIVVRWSETDEGARARFLESMDAGSTLAEAGLGGHASRRVAESLLNELLDADENQRVNSVMDFCEENGLSFSFEFLEEFNSKVYRQGTDRRLFARLAELLRSARRNP